MLARMSSADLVQRNGLGSALCWSMKSVIASPLSPLRVTSPDARAAPRKATSRMGGESGTEAQPHLYPGSYIEYVERTGHEAPGIHS